jgi:hypothetical protein
MDAVNVMTMVKSIIRTYRQIAVSKSFATDASKHKLASIPTYKQPVMNQS